MCHSELKRYFLDDSRRNVCQNVTGGVESLNAGSEVLSAQG